MPVQSSVIIHFVGQHGNNDARCRQSQDRDRLLAAARLAGRSGRAAVKQRYRGSAETSFSSDAEQQRSARFTSADFEYVPVRVSIETSEFENVKNKPHEQSAVSASLLQAPAAVILGRRDGTDPVTQAPFNDDSEAIRPTLVLLRLI